MTQTKAELLETKHQGDIRLGDANSSHYVGFKAPATVSSSLVWTLPAADGSANQFLKTNASGVLSWGTVDTSTLMPLGGGTHTGHVTYGDNVKAKFGTGGDLEIFHDTNDSFITNTGTGNLILRGDDVHIQGSNAENMINCNEDGSVDISYNNVKKLETTATGIAVTGAATISTDLTVTGDLTVSGTTTTINTATLDVEDKNVVLGKVSSPSDTTADGGGWTLKGASDKTFNWVNSTDAWTSSEHIHLGDNKKLLVGTGSDLSIYHNGNHSKIRDEGTGNLYIESVDGNIYLRVNDNEQGVTIVEDGAVEVYHNNVKKLETTSGGINVTGAINVNGAPLGGGNSFTAVANGSIANNKAVRLDTDGKVSEIKTSFAASRMSKTNGTQFNSSTDTRHSVTIYDPDANKVVTYWGNGVNSYMKNTTWPISSTTGAFSESPATTSVENTVQVQNDHQGDHDFDVVYDTNLNKHLFVFTNQNSGSIFSKYGTYNSSNNMVEYGQGSSYWDQIGNFAGSNPDVHYDSTTDRYVCVYRRTNNGYPYYVVGNQSGGTISWGTPTVIESVTVQDGNYINICSLGAGKVCILWKHASGNTVKATLGDISTSSNTLSNLYTPTQITTDQTNYHIIVYNEEDDNVIFFYRYDHDGNDYPYAKRITRKSGNNGIDVTSGSNVIVQDAITAGHSSAVYSPVTKTVHYLVRVGSDMYSTYVSNTSGVPTLVSTASANSHDVKFIGESCAGPASLGAGETIYVGLYNETRNNRGDMWSMTGISSASTLDSAQYYVGFADQAYTNGQTATIKTYGSVVDTLSGLTVGTDYYVKKDGSIGTSTDFTSGFAAGTPYAGRAISSSKLIVQHPSIMQGL